LNPVGPSRALPIHFFGHLLQDVSFSHNTQRETKPPKFPKCLE